MECSTFLQIRSDILIFAKPDNLSQELALVPIISFQLYFGQFIVLSNSPGRIPILQSKVEDESFPALAETHRMINLLTQLCLESVFCAGC